MLYLQNPPAGYLAVSNGHPGDAAPAKYKYGKYIYIITLNSIMNLNEMDKIILQNNILPNEADDRTNKIINISFLYNFLGMKDSITYSY